MTQLRLQDFLGQWVVDRTITDHGAGPNGRFTGQAIFTAHDGGALYEESGTLSLDGITSFKAERRYTWRETETGFAVTFGDGRPFHDFSPGSPKADHWCDPDTYRVAYNFDGWPEWSSTWDVSGPKKAYEMVTFYKR